MEYQSIELHFTSAFARIDILHCFEKNKIVFYSHTCAKVSNNAQKRFKCAFQISNFRYIRIIITYIVQSSTYFCKLFFFLNLFLLYDFLIATNCTQKLSIVKIIRSSASPPSDASQKFLIINIESCQITIRMAQITFTIIQLFPE